MRMSARLPVPAGAVRHALTDAAALRSWLAEHAAADLEAFLSRPDAAAMQGLLPADPLLLVPALIDHAQMFTGTGATSSGGHALVWARMVPSPLTPAGQQPVFAAIAAAQAEAGASHPGIECQWSGLNRFAAASRAQIERELRLLNLFSLLAVLAVSCLFVRQVHKILHLVPVILLAIVVALWGAIVRLNNIPPYVLPSPGLVAATLIADGPLLLHSLWVTLVTTFEGFALAAVGGIGLAVLFSQSRLVEISLYPYAVILQVTPVVAVAPLLLIYLPQPLAVLACAWIVAFFPVLANTTLGLNSVEHNLLALFELYKASRWQVLWRLKLPAALPQMLTGLRIAGGLSLIGAVVAEIAAGSAGAGSGLAYRIAESGYRLNIPRMFAALLLLSVAGVCIYFVLSFLSHLMLRRWHESAIARER